MARRHGFVSTLNKIVREAARTQRNAERARVARQREIERQERLARQYERQQFREAERALKQSIKEQKAFEKEQKLLYLESRKEETADLNNEVSYILEEFDNVLKQTLKVNDSISFDSLYHKETFPSFEMPKLKEIPVKPDTPISAKFMNKETPTLAEIIFGFGKKQREKRAEEAYKIALEEYNNVITLIDDITRENEDVLFKTKEKYELEKREYDESVKQKNLEIDEFKQKYFNGDKDAVEAYCVMVLERSDYLDVFPQDFELFYIIESKELLIEYELPAAVNCIPEFKEYKYIQSKDEIKGSEFKEKEKNEIYSKLIASITLRTLHEIFEADEGNKIDSIVFNGIVKTIDLSTGLEKQPCIITLQTKIRSQ